MEKQGTIEEASHESLLEKTNFWQNFLGRLVNITLMLAKCILPFRESSKELLKNNKANFLSIIQLLAKCDTVVDKLLTLTNGSPKYLSPLIQNELISVLDEKVLRDIKSELQIVLLTFLSRGISCDCLQHLLIHCHWPRQSCLSYAKAPSSLWHGFSSSHLQSLLVFAFLSFHL